MKVLYINSLDKRYGSTYRSRSIVKALIELHHDVMYVESNLDKKISDCDMSINHKDGFLGYVRATYKRALLALRLDYDILFLQKFIPLIVPCLVIGKIRGKKCIVDWDDLDFCYQKNTIKKIIVFMCEHIFPYLADCITTHSHQLEVYGQRRGFKRFEIVNQVIDFENIEVSEEEKQELKLRIGAGDKKIICFLGTLTMGGVADLDIIIESISEISKKRQDIFFLIIGGGPLEQNVLDMLKDNKMDNFSHITGLIDHNDVQRFLAISKVGFVYMRNNLGNRMRVSFKVLEYLYSGLFVAGCLVGESRDRFSQYCTATNSNVYDLRGTLKNILDSNIANKDIVLEGYSLQDIEQSLNRVVN